MTAKCRCCQSTRDYHHYSPSMMMTMMMLVFLWTLEERTATSTSQRIRLARSFLLGRKFAWYLQRQRRSSPFLCRMHPLGSAASWAMFRHGPITATKSSLYQISFDPLILLNCGRTHCDLNRRQGDYSANGRSCALSTMALLPIDTWAPFVSASRSSRLLFATHTLSSLVDTHIHSSSDTHAL